MIDTSADEVCAFSISLLFLPQQGEKRDFGERTTRVGLTHSTSAKKIVVLQPPNRLDPRFDVFWASDGLTMPQQPDDGGKLRSFFDNPEAHPLSTPSGKNRNLGYHCEDD